MKYVVKSGDSLSKIGASLGVSWSSIASANGIKAPYIIKPGQTLEVPTSGSGGVVQAPQPYSGQPLYNYNQGQTNSSSSTGQAMDFSSPLTMVINGAILYGIFRVLIKAL